MKKTILSCAILGCALLTSCGFGTTAPAASQTSQPSAANQSVLGNILGDIIGTVTGGMMNQNSIQGTWTYTAPCVQFESENLLAKAGGAVIAAKVESNLDSYYQKVGIKPGACKFTFGADNKLTMQIGSKTHTGTYKLDANTKTITMTGQFGNNLTAYVSQNGNMLGLTFDASKLLTLLTAYTANSASTQLSTIGSIAQNYSGMKLGFKFAK